MNQMRIIIIWKIIMKKNELFKFILYRYLIDMKLFSSKLMQMNILFNIINININKNIKLLQYNLS